LEAHLVRAPDQTLIQRARAGDPAAFQALLAPLVQPAYLLAFGMLRQREAAEDAVQEATFRAWRKIRQVREDTPSLRPWFLTIVANECRTVRRGRWWGVIRLADVLPAPAPVPDDGGAAADLRRTVERLRHRDRLLLHLHYWLDLPLEEVAAVLGTTPGAAKARRHRLLRRLRLDLGSEEVAR
jgi:RNA polymerase sigma-70 factor (ECF subfamily)